MATRSAYEISDTEAEFAEREYGGFDMRYAVPDVAEDSPYNDEFGWAPALRLGIESTPDTSRLGTQPRRDFRPDPVRPPQEFYGRNARDIGMRHRVEDIDANGWEETKRGTGHAAPDNGAYRWAADPRSIPPAESRVTQQMAPRSYSFTRPFGHTLAKMGARALNGMHFSMADHRREYDIYGMQPARTLRNTFRLEPRPWDTDLVDMPPENVAGPNVQPVRSVEVEYGNSRSWRLG